jgi:hypothetical protein
MHRTALLGFSALLLAGVTLGEDFWVKKDYTQWTDEEVKKMMTSSPWAKDVSVPVPASAVRGGRGPASSSSGVDTENSAGGRGRGGGGGGGGRGGQRGNTTGAAGNPQITLTISWRSAMPLRKAIVKSRIGTSSEVPAELLQALSQGPQDYVVVVGSLPVRLAKLVQDPVRLNRSYLKIGKRAPIVPKSVEFQTRPQNFDVFFVFSKDEPITLDDKEVELDLLLGPTEAKRKFTLKDMVYNGKLEL